MHAAAQDRGGTTVEDLCKQIHKSLVAEYSYSLVWGTSSKHYPQRWIHSLHFCCFLQECCNKTAILRLSMQNVGQALEGMMLGFGASPAPGSSTAALQGLPLPGSGNLAFDMAEHYVVLFAVLCSMCADACKSLDAHQATISSGFVRFQRSGPLPWQQQASLNTVFQSASQKQNELLLGMDDMGRQTGLM